MKLLKIFFLILLITLSTTTMHSSTFANNATNIEAEQTKNMDNPPVIEAQEKKFNIFSLVYTLKGDVHIRHKTRSITADFAEYKLTSQEVKASGNIEFQDGNFAATCDHLYAPTKADRVDLMGNIIFRKNDVTIYADNASFNWNSKVATFENNVTVDNNGTKKQYNTVQYKVTTGEFL